MTEIEYKIEEAGHLIAGELARNGAPCVTSSFQTECVVLVHMLVKQRPEIPVLFLETGYHFPETLEYRDRISNDWKLNLINLEAKQSVAGRSRIAAARCAKSSRCLGVWRTTIRGSPLCGGSSRPRAPTFSRSSRSNCRRGKRFKRSARSPPGPTARCGRI
jgi:Phosphoadenosine phosphosulfate reductase family